MGRGGTDCCLNLGNLGILGNSSVLVISNLGSLENLGSCGRRCWVEDWRGTVKGVCTREGEGRGVHPGETVQSTGEQPP